MKHAAVERVSRFAENNLFAGKYCDKIMQQMQVRGFGDLLTKQKIACANTASFQKASGTAGTMQVVTTAAPSKSGGSSGCGILGLNDVQKSATPIGFFFWAWPLILGLVSFRRKRYPTT